MQCVNLSFINQIYRVFVLYPLFQTVGKGTCFFDSLLRFELDFFLAILVRLTRQNNNWLESYEVVDCKLIKNNKLILGVYYYQHCIFTKEDV